MNLKFVFVMAFVIAAIIFKFWLFSGLSVGIDATAVHDDFLHIKQADSILRGEWLGSFDNLTLAKGPFYPLFIALSRQTGIPLLTTQQLLYVLACVIASLPLGLIAKKHQKVVFVGSFVILLFNPFSFDGNLNLRINRPAIYQSLSLLTIGSYLSSLVLVDKIKWRRWYFLTLVLGGIFLSFSWLTREENVWLLVPTLIIFIKILHVAFKQNQALFGVLSISSSIIFFLIYLGTVLLVNKNYYGQLIITEYQHPAFIAAYGSLTRVKSDYFTPYAPAPQNVRAKIAQVSPTFASINRFLEGKVLSNWATITKNEAPLANGEFDIGGGWFMWALRDAVAAAGHYNTLTEALRFYEQLAKEVNDACNKKELDCIAERNTFIPPWNNSYFPNIRNYSWLLLKKLFFFTDVWPHYEERREPVSNFLLFQEITQEKPHAFLGEDIRIQIILLIKHIYKIFLLPLSIVGILIYLFQAFKARLVTLYSLESFMILVVWSGFTTLSGILILLAATSYPLAIDSGYMGPLPPLLYITVMLMFIQGVNQKINRGDQRVSAIREEK